MLLETEVISCPACKHLLRVPLDLLGQQVQCPECKAMFKAPARDGTGGLTDPELIARPSATPGVRKKTDPMLLLPAFGLMFLGFTGMLVNGVLTYMSQADPDGAKEYLRQQIATLRQYGFGSDDPEAERDRLDVARAEKTADILRWVLPAAGVAATLAFLGGLSIVLHWNRRLAQIGCAAAVLDVTGFCCVPGSVAGVWGLLMLASEEGRGHFSR
jgi:hypothetical protein